jgi:hypothetical protein
MPAERSEQNQDVVRVKAVEEQEVENLLTQIEERKTVAADLEMSLETLRREIEQFEMRYYAAVGSLLAQLQRLQIQIEECYLRAEEIEQSGRAAMRWQREEDARRTLREKQAAAEEYERRAREASAKQKEQPVLTTDQQKDLKSLYRRLAKAFHPDLANGEREREWGARLMTEINDAYARGDVDHLRLIAEREQPFATDANEILSQRIERLTRQRDALDETIHRLRQQLSHLERGEFSRLKREADASAAQGRNFLSDLTAKLKARIRNKEQELRWARQELEDVISAARGGEDGEI